MPKLTDIQLIILSTAAQREDGAALPLPKSAKLQGGAISHVLKSLLNKGLLAEQPAGSNAAAWRESKDGQRLMLIVTDAGRAAIGVPADEQREPTRFAVQTDKIERGMVLIPRAAEWLPEFKRELLAFPNGRYDDQVDSMTQFLDWIGGRRGRATCELQLNGGRPLAPPRPQDFQRPP